MNYFTTFLSILYLSTTTVRGSSLLRGDKPSSKYHGDTETRHLQQQKSFNGKCTVANFSAMVGGESALAGILKVPQTEMQKELDDRCAAALNPTLDLSVALGKGPQFLKNFLDGGTTWNDNYEKDGEYVLAEDAAIIPTLYEESAKTTVFSSPDGGTSDTYPQYFSNFYNGDKECRLGVIECCYTASRSPEGSPGLVNNAEMCALDLTLSAKSNHIQSPEFRPSFTYYGTKDQDDSYCSGFAWEEDSFSDAVKYNTLFHMAMKTNLYDKNYVKNIPGAPMCGCVEQMPVVDNADCVKAIEGYTIDADGNVGVSISWEDCGTDLYSHYESLNGRKGMEKSFVKEKIVGEGQCEAAAVSFMNEQMYRKKQS